MIRQPTDPYDDYAWWRQALRRKGDYSGAPAHETYELLEIGEEPQVGWYAMRTEYMGPLRPVVIWRHSPVDPQTGELISDETLHARLDGKDVPLDKVWPRCALTPVSVAQFRNMEGAIYEPPRIGRAARVLVGRVDPLSQPPAF